MSARQVLGVVYHLMTEGADADARLEIDAELDPAAPHVQAHRRAAVYAMGGEIG